MKVQTFPITLVESFMLSPKVKHFIFAAEHNPPFQYKPGQFITIHFEKDGNSLKRSYSVANPPRGDNRIEFAAGYVENGPGTELLFNLNPGDQININGPFGRLILKEELPGRMILVATSTGVTPYRAMLPSLRHLLKNNTSLEVVILQGVQRRDEVLYADEFQAFAKEFSNVTFCACLSRVEATELQEFERSGYVQHCFDDLAVNPGRDLVYLCGNPGMIDDSFALLKEKGFETHQIIREKYLSR
ncbi:ferredoxin--NADP reductase [Legionella sp. W05-934-2]|uniref:ferredoxin--NADP reductase n=1 Tax=Legionella sp. W05-934-2 TaxID=1198649 RepID=UPI0034634C83